MNSREPYKTIHKTFLYPDDLVQLYDCFFNDYPSPNLLKDKKLQILAFEVLVSIIHESRVTDELLGVGELLSDIIATARNSTDEALDTRAIRYKIISTLRMNKTLSAPCAGR